MMPRNLLDEKQGPPMYCRFRPTSRALAEEFAQDSRCHLHESIDSLTLLGGIVWWFAKNMQPRRENGQGVSCSETEALLNKFFGGVKGPLD
jgi:hypothetical protein